MKEYFNIVDSNIQNLTSLWKIAGISFNAYYENPVFDYCECENSGWPNRLWFNQSLCQKNIDVAKEKLLSISSKLTVPHWTIGNDTSYKLLEDNGFRLKFEQTAMYLRMMEVFHDTKNLVFSRVSNREEATLWADIYPKSFGYTINREILARTWDTIHYYTAFYQREPIGTAILFRTGNVMGIHGVGVVPEMRKRGFAEQIMKALLNKAMEDNVEFATLQASTMGKNIYVKLGFEEQFTIRNYVL